MPFQKWLLNKGFLQIRAMIMIFVSRTPLASGLQNEVFQIINNFVPNFYSCQNDNLAVCGCSPGFCQNTDNNYKFKCDSTKFLQQEANGYFCQCMFEQKLTNGAYIEDFVMLDLVFSKEEEETPVNPPGAANSVILIFIIVVFLAVVLVVIGVAIVKQLNTMKQSNVMVTTDQASEMQLI